MRMQDPKNARPELLQASDVQLRLLVASVRDYAIFMLSPEGSVVTWNSGAEAIKGYGAEDIIGQLYAIFFDKDDVEQGKPTRLLHEATELGRVEDEGWRMRRDGSRFWANAIITAIRDDAGTLVGFSKVTRDMTRSRLEKQRQDEMRARLILTDRMASLGTLAAGVAHEVNNPLASVTSNLELIGEEIRAMTGASPSGRMRGLSEMVEEARRGAERVRRIVKDLHTLARAEQHSQGPVDLRAVLDLSLNMASNEIEHRARIVRDYGSVPLVEGDDGRLAQVFVNLLVNAAQAIAEGQPDTNEIRITTRTDSLGRAVVEVRDTGSGVPAELLNRIFDPFFTTKAIGVGTGLGLPVCHAIVTGLGGEIVAESDAGSGTMFRVVLPALRAEVPEPAKALAREEASGGRRGRVLVVDDEPSIGIILRRMLASEHDTTVVASGQAALDLLLGGASFDIIFCDLMMPNMTGMDLHAEVARTLPEMTERIVFLSGGSFTDATQAFIDSVPNQRMAKPFAAQNIRALVRTFVSK